MKRRTERPNAPAFGRLQNTYATCSIFTGILLSTTVAEIVLASHDGDPFAVAARTAASIAAALAIASIAGFIVAPVLDRYADVRLGKTGALQAFAIGTLCAIPLLVNKLVR